MLSSRRQLDYSASICSDSGRQGHIYVQAACCVSGLDRIPCRAEARPAAAVLRPKRGCTHAQMQESVDNEAAGVPTYT